MNPIDDTFLSAGDDQTVRLWDLRMPECKVSQVGHTCADGSGGVERHGRTSHRGV